MKLYKLTNKDLTTKGGMLWGNGVTHELPVKPNPELCTTDVIHCYESLELAAFMRYTHGYGNDILCFEAEGDVVVSDGSKCGVFRLTTIKQIELPSTTIKQTVIFALLSAKSIFKNCGSMDAAIEAAKAGDFSAAAYAAHAAARAAWAAGAADAAVAVAYGAAYAARAARADWAAGAADAAADAADAAARAAGAVDLKAIAIEAISYE